MASRLDVETRRRRSATPRPRRSGTDEDEVLSTDLDDEDDGDDWDDLSSTSSDRRRRRGRRGSRHSVRDKHWRGGTPAPPPEFDGDVIKDPACLRKWVKLVEVWLAKTKEQLPPNEQALALYSALKGKAYTRVENWPVSKFNCADGVQIIIEAMEGYKEFKMARTGAEIVKYENITRTDGESVIDFVERFENTEENLRSIGIAPYPTEGRSVKLLKGARLNREGYHHVLSHSRGAFDYDSLRDAMRVQFPQAHTLAALLGKQPQSTQAPSNRSVFVPKFRKALTPGKDPKKVSRVFWSEDGTQLLQYEDGSVDGFEESEAVDDGSVENLDEEDMASVLATAADALTMTAQKLKPTTLGRGYFGKGSPSAAGKPFQRAPFGPKGPGSQRPPAFGQRQAPRTIAGLRPRPGESLDALRARLYCAACGGKGHAPFDQACPQFSANFPNGLKKVHFGETTEVPSVDGFDGFPPPEVVQVNLSASADGSMQSPPHASMQQQQQQQQQAGSMQQLAIAGAPRDQMWYNAPGEQTPPFYYSYVSDVISLPVVDVFDTVVTHHGDMKVSCSAYLVIDTGCQSNVAGSKWISAKREALATDLPQVGWVTGVDQKRFQFGAGSVQPSLGRHRVPIGLGGFPCEMRVSESPTEIPCLGSRPMCQNELKLILDLPCARAYCGALDIILPLCLTVNKHLAVRIDDFGEHGNWNSADWPDDGSSEFYTPHAFDTHVHASASCDVLHELVMNDLGGPKQSLVTFAPVPSVLSEEICSDVQSVQCISSREASSDALVHHGVPFLAADWSGNESPLLWNSDSPVLSSVQPHCTSYDIASASFDCEFDEPASDTLSDDSRSVRPQSGFQTLCGQLWQSEIVRTMWQSLAPDRSDRTVVCCESQESPRRSEDTLAWYHEDEFFDVPLEVSKGSSPVQVVGAQAQFAGAQSQHVGSAGPVQFVGLSDDSDLGLHTHMWYDEGEEFFEARSSPEEFDFGVCDSRRTPFELHSKCVEQSGHASPDVSIVQALHACEEESPQQCAVLELPSLSHVPRDSEHEAGRVACPRQLDASESSRIPTSEPARNVRVSRDTAIDPPAISRKAGLRSSDESRVSSSDSTAHFRSLANIGRLVCAVGAVCSAAGGIAGNARCSPSDVGLSGFAGHASNAGPLRNSGEHHACSNVHRISPGSAHAGPGPVPGPTGPDVPDPPGSQLAKLQHRVVQSRAANGSSGDHPVQSRPGSLEVGLIPMRSLKSGRLKQLLGDVRKAMQALTVEQQCYATGCKSANRRIRWKLHVLEVFSGSAHISHQAVNKWGLRVGTPIDICNGFDLSSKMCQEHVWKYVQTNRPLVTVLGVPCTVWSIFNENMNYRAKDRLSELMRARHASLPMVRWVVKLCMWLHENGLHFLVENPVASRLWEAEPLLRLGSISGVVSVVGHQCAYGCRGSHGKFLLKPTRWMTNHQALASAVSRKCPVGHTHQHTTPIHNYPIEHEHEPSVGGNAKRAQVYTLELADAICEVVKQFEQEHSVHAVMAVRPPIPRHRWVPRCCDGEWIPPGDYPIVDAFYMDVDREPNAWKETLDAAERYHGARGTSTISVPDGHELYQQVQRLCPWDIARVQVAHLPKARRLPTDIAYTHRAAVFKCNDDTIEVESEPIDSPSGPRLRFSKPIKVAIFIFGVAPESPPEPDGRPDELGTSDPIDEERHAGLAHISFPGLTDAQCPRVVKQTVARVHENFGHPRRRDLVVILANEGASLASLQAARALRCTVCDRLVRPKEARPTKLPRVGYFNERVSFDVVFIPDCLGRLHPFMNIIDDASLLQKLSYLSDRTSAMAFQVLRDVWILPYGPMRELVTDCDGSFRGETDFLKPLSVLGIQLKIIPADAHWQLGRAERHGYAIKTIMTKIIDSLQFHEIEDLKLAAIMACDAKNDMLRRAGASPYMFALGRRPKLPGALLSDPEGVTSHEAAVEGDAMFDKVTEVRSCARRCYAEYEDNQHLRAAMLRKGRPWRGPLVVGQRCAGWRTQRTAKRASGRRTDKGYVLGTIVTLEPGLNGNVWMRTDSGRLMLFAREQLRAACGQELWAPHPLDLETMRELQKDLESGDASYEDARGPGPTDGEDLESAEVSRFPIPIGDEAPLELDHHPDARGSDDLVGLPVPRGLPVPLEPLADEMFTLGDENDPPPPPRTSLSRSSATRAVMDERPQSVDRSILGKRKLEMKSETPPESVVENQPVRATPKARIASPILPPDLEGVLDDTAMDSLDAQSASLLMTPLSTHDFAFVLSDVQPDHDVFSVRCLVARVGGVWRHHDWSVDWPSAPIRLPSQADAFCAIYLRAGCSPAQVFPPSWDAHYQAYMARTMFEPNYDGWCTCRQPCGWDGSEDLPAPFVGSHRFESRVDRLVADGLVCPVECFVGDQDELERRYRGAKDSENNVYLDSDDEQVGSDGSPTLSRVQQKAFAKELPWKLIDKASLPAFRHCALSEWEEWLRWGSIKPFHGDVDTIPKGRILPSRYAYRWKPQHDGPPKAKGRIVVQGFRDPDLAILLRDSPVLSRTGFMAILQFTASQFLCDDGHWILRCGDCKSAFLQGGKAPERPQPLYMRPPRDPISTSVIQFAPLYEIVGSVYGLSNSPRLWFAEIVQRFLSKCELPGAWRQHSLDCTVFIYTHSGRILAVCGWHVDDCIYCYHPQHVEIKQWMDRTFSWGSEHESCFDFCGKCVTQDMQSGDIKIDMIKFVMDSHVFKAQSRGRLTDTLTTDERTEFRSVIGSLQWVGSMCRPDVTADTSLLQSGDVRVQDLVDAEKTLQYLRATAADGITVVPIPLDKLAIVPFTDASWGNAPGGRSQAGMLICACHEDVLTSGSRASVLEWKSHRLKRSTRSTLGSEAASMDAGCDHAYYLAMFMSEFSHVMFRATLVEKPIVPVYPCTDCKSLFDALHKLSVSVDEKRVQIDLSSIRESVDVESLRWVPTTQMHADALTKRSPSLRDSFRQWLQKPFIQLQASPDDSVPV